MDLTQWINAGTKFLEYSFGVSDANTSEMLIYRFLILMVISWISLFTFLAIRKPYLLKNWKIPHLANLTFIILIAFCASVVSYFLVSNLNLLIFLSDKTYDSVNFFHVCLFMIIYICLGLETIHKKIQNKNDVDFVPSETKVFVSRSIILIFGLIMIEFSQIALINFLGTAPQNFLFFPTTHSLIDKIFGSILSILFFLFGLFFCLMAFLQNKMKEILKRFDAWSKKNPRALFSIILILMVFLTLKYFLEKNYSQFIPLLIISILILLIIIFIEKIKLILNKSKDKIKSLKSRQNQSK